MDITFRLGTEEDSELVVRLIYELAEYEKLLDQVTTNEERVRKSIRNREFEVLFACLEDGTIAGYAMFFPDYASLVGRQGLYLENIYVMPEYRGLGIGEKIMRELVRIAGERGYAKMEWHCLTWNDPANELYLKLGTEQKLDWIYYRLSENDLDRLNNK
jgi:GNAT superfamily N-acetyltransferase